MTLEFKDTGCLDRGPLKEWSVRERRLLSLEDAGSGSAIEAGAAGAVRNGDWRRNRLGDPGGQGRTNPETRRRSSEARMGHGVMMADHVGHYVERPVGLARERLHRSTPTDAV